MFKNVASQKLIVFAFDSTTNSPKTGDAANITAYVSKDYGSVTVLGDTSATEMDSTNAKGYYLFDLTQGETNADTLLFSAKSSTANIVVIGAPACVFTDPPNYTTAAIDSSGRVTANVTQFGGSNGTFSSGRPEVNTTHAAGTAWGSGAITNSALAADTGLKPIRSNTAQAGAATTITLDASASAVDNFYLNDLVYLTGGTGAGQARFITGYVGATKVATVGTWATNPDNTSTFAILPSDGTSAPTAATIADAVWDEARTDHTAAGSFGQGAASVQGNVTGSVASVTGAVGSVTGNVGGNVTGSVGSVGTGGIVAGSFGAGAIDNAAIAADAIGSSELAASAATEIANAVAALALTEPTAVVAASPTLIAALSWLLTLSRNKITQTSTTQILKADDGSTTIASSTVSDDGTTFTRGEFA